MTSEEVRVDPQWKSDRAWSWQQQQEAGSLTPNKLRATDLPAAADKLSLANGTHVLCLGSHYPSDNLQK